MGTQGSGNVCEIADAYKYKEIISFIQGGGGLLVAMCPWGFEQVRQTCIFCLFIWLLMIL